ncbi:MAG TPA: NADH-quinone oxidoreductase subunit J [Acidimicrobiales bacterium]|nr:NADH-quinone oxidoreductase subunit J [Acidimicrobiales bacterium]
MLAALLTDSSGQTLAQASAWAVFAVGAALIITGALGVILLRNPVHCALMLVITLFGIALEFIDESADFLAAVQIIVYAGAVVILFLFVIMFLGVDRKEATGGEPTRFQRPLALILGIVALVELLALSRIDHWTGGTPSQSGALKGTGDNVQKLGQLLYTGYLLPFEMTAALLVIAVVAAVVLSRRHHPSAGEMSALHQEELMGSPDAVPDGPTERVGATSQPDLGDQP